MANLNIKCEVCGERTAFGVEVIDGETLYCCQRCAMLEFRKNKSPQLHKQAEKC